MAIHSEDARTCPALESVAQRVPMNVVVTVVVILLMVSANALFVAAEFATVGSRRSRIQTAAQGGNRSAARLLEIVADPVALDNYVAACQIGITLSSLVAGAYGQAQLTPLLEPVFGSAGQAVAVVVTLVLITALQVVLGELLPKTAALRYPERLAIGTVRPMQISQWLFRPLVAIFNGSAFAVMGWFGLRGDHSHAHVHSPEELAGLFEESAAGGLIDVAERDMVAGVLNVEHRHVREIMTPRRRIVGIDETASVGAALQELVERPHSRFPVWSGADRDVRGLVHLRDLYLQSRVDPNVAVTSVARPVLAVAETLTVPALWQMLDEAEEHCALVVNEYGAVAGIVTLEDAIEEIFGEVRDEFDSGPDPIVIEGSRASVHGEVLLEDLNRRFGLSLPTDTVDTVGGLVWHELGRVPVRGERVELADGHLSVTIDDVELHAIDRLSFDIPGMAS
ncbi:MAG: hemolysin family protein [Acidimicrobiales bacterium]